MYKYQCSKQDCGTIWALNEGRLNGFVLTCPICGKGRGIYLEQLKGNSLAGEEEIIITLNSGSNLTTEEVQEKIDHFIDKYALHVISNKIENMGSQVTCVIQYKLKG
ncbi:MAG: hypothetical protein N2645_06405 [Clostridia bacterium]|nr:hypothetical protein [Clostridia bacterium]